MLFCSKISDMSEISEISEKKYICYDVCTLLRSEDYVLVWCVCGVYRYSNQTKREKRRGVLHMTIPICSLAL